MRLVLVMVAVALAAPAAADAPRFRGRGPVDRVPAILWREGDPAFGRPAPPGAAPGEPLTPGDWRFWWAWNRDAILDLRLPRHEHVYCTPPTEGSLAWRDESEWGEEAPWRGDWDRFVRPVLIGIARGRDEPAELRARALLALGRARESVPLLAELASEHTPEPELRATALLALGLTGHPWDAGSGPLLLAADEGQPSPLRVRALAACALLPPGSVPSATSLEILRSSLARDDRELVVGALVALRAQPSFESLPALLDLAESGAAGGRPVDDLVLAHAVHAACRLPLRARDGDPLARRRSKALHGLLRGPGRLTGIAAIRGLGECVARDDDPDRAAAVAALALVAAGGPGEEGDQRRGLALIALARSTIRDGEGGVRAREVLASAFSEGGPIAGWAAIAMGVARDRPAPPGDEPAGTWCRALSLRLVDATATPGPRAAAALALGLIGDRNAVPALRRLVANREAPVEVRRAAAEALGLLPGESARDGIRAALRDRGCRSLRAELFLSAGLQLDAESAPVLAEILESPDSDAASRGAAARALGWIAAVAVRDRLLSAARDPLGRRSPEVREAAVAALGGYAGRGARGERTMRRDAIGRLAAEFPYRAWTPGMGAVLDEF